MSISKLGLAALVASCCVVTVTAAEAGPRARRAKPKTASAATATNNATPAPTKPAALLPVDCVASAKDPRCGRVSWVAGGSIGSGPAVRGGPGFPSIGDGFVDGNRLVAAVELGAQSDDNGAIMSFDLTTGDRTIVSGKTEDPAKGPVTVGTGPDLGFVRGVAQSGSTWLALVSKGSTDPVSIIRIDPKTGNRTLEAKIDKPPTCAGSTAKLQIDPTSGIAASPDGTAYVAAGNMSRAVTILAFKGGSCSVVTMSGAGGFESKGSGPTIESQDHYRSLRYEGGKIWALHGITNSLMTIDVATGNRARVSSGESSTRVGAGDAKLGYTTLALAGARVWTVGAWAGTRDFILTDALVSNGQRTSHDAPNGPASRDGATGVFVHPTKPLLVLVVDNAVVLYDPATGANAIVST